MSVKFVRPALLACLMLVGGIRGWDVYGRDKPADPCAAGRCLRACPSCYSERQRQFGPGGYHQCGNGHNL
jgi:hypothetical protein